MKIRKSIIILIILLIVLTSIAVIYNIRIAALEVELKKAQLEAIKLKNETLSIKIPKITVITVREAYPTKDLKIYISELLSRSSSTIKELNKLLISVNNTLSKDLFTFLLTKLEYVNKSLNKAWVALTKGNLGSALDEAESAIIFSKHAEVFIKLILNKTSITEVMESLKNDMRKLEKLYQKIKNEFDRYLVKDQLDLNSLIISYIIEENLGSAKSLLKWIYRKMPKGNIYVFDVYVEGAEEKIPNIIKLDFIGSLAGELEMVRHDLRTAQMLLKRLKWELSTVKPYKNIKVLSRKELYELYELLLIKFEEVKKLNVSNSTLAYQFLNLVENAVLRIKRLVNASNYMRAEPLIEIIHTLARIYALKNYYDELVRIPLETEEMRNKRITIDNLKELLKAKKEAANTINMVLSRLKLSPYYKILVIPLWRVSYYVEHTDQLYDFVASENPLEMDKFEYVGCLWRYSYVKYFALGLKDLVDDVESIFSHKS